MEKLFIKRYELLTELLKSYNRRIAITQFPKQLLRVLNFQPNSRRIDIGNESLNFTELFQETKSQFSKVGDEVLVCFIETNTSQDTFNEFLTIAVNYPDKNTFFAINTNNLLIKEPFTQYCSELTFA
ncbi:hypothetical protein IT417_02070 [bacterium]|nr:hypothetical protein [bacterium]